MDHREPASGGPDRPAGGPAKDAWPVVGRGRPDGGPAAAVVDPPTEPFAIVRPDPSGAGSVPGPNDRRDAGLGTWTFTDAMVGLGAVLLASAVIGAAVQIAVDAGLPRGPWVSLSGLLPVWIGLLGTTVWACRRHGSGSLVTDLGLRVRWSDVAAGLGMAIVGRVVATLVAALVIGVTRQSAGSNLQDLVAPGSGRVGWLVVYAVAIALVGPVVEEIFFRGLALRSALASLGRSRRPRFATPAARQRFAALLTAGLFAALHLPEVTSVTMLLILMPSLFFFGWLLARWTMRTGRLGGAIVAHIGFNAVAAGVLLWGGLG